MSETLPKPERRQSSAWIVIVIVLAVLLLCSCILVLAIALSAYLRAPGPRQQPFRLPSLNMPLAGRTEIQRELEQTFVIETPVLLEIENNVGPIKVMGSDGDRVRVRAQVRGFGASLSEAQKAADDVEVRITQRDRHTLQLTGRVPPGIRYLQSPSVAFTVEVPRQCTLQITNNVGQVEVHDIVGSLQVSVSVGEIDVRNLTLAGDTTLTSNVGRVRVELPRGSAFHLDAQTNVGNIVSDFEVPAGAPSRPGVGDRLQGPVGDRPEFTLKLRADTGEIRILERR